MKAPFAFAAIAVGMSTRRSVAQTLQARPNLGDS
jgi:hypothetical protein